jgi:hypothetical protein
MDYYDEDFFWELALPRANCLLGWIVPLLLDKRVDIVFCVKTISV